MRGLYAALGVAILLGAASPAAAQIGACCPPPCYDCRLLTEEQCDSLGGMWFGGSCDPAP